MSRLLLSVVLTGYALACTAIETDRISGHDLAAADARFAALPDDLTVAFTPAPGRQRLLDAALLATLARQHGIPDDGITPFCFERSTVMLDEARLRPVLERALGSGTKLEIVEFSRYPVPKGELKFAASDLGRPAVADAAAPVIWRGAVRFGSHNSAPVWVRVRVQKFETWVEAAAPIAAHKPIEAGQVAVKSGWRFPFAVMPVSDAGAVKGKQSIRSLTRGQVIFASLLTASNEIEHGDRVDIEVASGAVHLRFEGRAETGGRRAEMIVVTADSGKRYRARIQEKGKVVISADVTRKPLAGSQRADAGVDGGAGPSQSEEDQAVRAAILAGSLSH